MANSGFSYKLRTQFSFIAEDRTLSLILSGIAEQAINITGYLQTKSFETGVKSCNAMVSKCNLVRLVVGSPDAETSRDLLGVTRVLRSLGVSFLQKEVIQVLEIQPGVPGVINSIFGALWCREQVNAIYLGEETRLFLDVANNTKAIQILSQTPVRQCIQKPKTCCK